MTIRQGFNRLGVSVAIAFLGLAVVCLLAAGTNYAQYRSEIAQELQKRTTQQASTLERQAIIRAELIATSAWRRFSRARYRSVDQALDLAGLCLLAALVSVIFWGVIGWIFAKFEGESERSAG